jgi:hypothetical protein
MTHATAADFSQDAVIPHHFAGTDHQARKSISMPDT